MFHQLNVAGVTFHVSSSKNQNDFKKRNALKIVHSLNLIKKTEIIEILAKYSIYFFVLKVFNVRLLLKVFQFLVFKKMVETKMVTPRMLTFHQLKLYG
jgi:hypothetical protein